MDSHLEEVEDKISNIDEQTIGSFSRRSTNNGGAKIQSALSSAIDRSLDPLSDRFIFSLRRTHYLARRISYMSHILDYDFCAMHHVGKSRMREMSIRRRDGWRSFRRG